jgi:PIN domain nuclease of toxin-antitoxin system
MTTLLLLDSHVLMWVLDDNPRLGPRARKIVTSGDEVFVSAATVFELTVKATLGKITVPDSLSQRLAEQGLSLLSISADHAEGLRQFPELAKHDPFDRLLVAQASMTGLRLLTADRVLLALGHEFIVDATA